MRPSFSSRCIQTRLTCINFLVVGEPYIFHNGGGSSTSTWACGTPQTLRLVLFRFHIQELMAGRYVACTLIRVEVFEGILLLKLRTPRMGHTLITFLHEIKSPHYQNHPRAKQAVCIEENRILKEWKFEGKWSRTSDACGNNFVKLCALAGLVEKVFDRCNVLARLCYIVSKFPQPNQLLDQSHGAWSTHQRYQQCD